MADYKERIGRRIQAERKKLSLSELELAAKVGTTDKTVRRWERGQSQPQPRNVRALAETFKIATSEIQPDIEAEEQAVLAQLNRIEHKLNRLLVALGVNPADDDANGAKRPGRTSTRPGT